MEVLTYERILWFETQSLVVHKDFIYLLILLYPVNGSLFDMLEYE